jgi:hypothetical protein
MHRPDGGSSSNGWSLRHPSSGLQPRSSRGRLCSEQSAALQTASNHRYVCITSGELHGRLRSEQLLCSLVIIRNLQFPLLGWGNMKRNFAVGSNSGSNSRIIHKCGPSIPVTYMCRSFFRFAYSGQSVVLNAFGCGSHIPDRLFIVVDPLFQSFITVL